MAATVSTPLGGTTGAHWLLSPSPVSTLAPPTPCHSLVLDVDRQVLEECHRGSPYLCHLNSCNHNTPTPSTSLGDALAPPTPNYCLALDMGQTQHGKGHNLGLHFSEAVHAHRGSTSVLCECMSLTCFCNHSL